MLGGILGINPATNERAPQVDQFAHLACRPTRVLCPDPLAKTLHTLPQNVAASWPLFGAVWGGQNPLFLSTLGHDFSRLARHSPCTTFMPESRLPLSTSVREWPFLAATKWHSFAVDHGRTGRIGHAGKTGDIPNGGKFGPLFFGTRR